MTSTQQGHFELTQFHGVPAVIFDSHWFALQIMDSDGRVFMCTRIDVTAYRADEIKVGPGGESNLPYYSSMCYAAMAPYRDFMAREAKEPQAEKLYHAHHLQDLFYIGSGPSFKDPLSFYDTIEFRVKAARRMLDAPPVRYCVLLNS